jgi:hypothetical protein
MLDAVLPRPAAVCRAALPALASFAVSDCENALEKLFIIIIFAIVLGAIIFGFFMAVLIVNIVHMIRKKPRLGWAVTSCVCGGMIALGALQGMLFGLQADALGLTLTRDLGAGALAAAMIWIGLKNAREAKRLASPPAVAQPWVAQAPTAPPQAAQPPAEPPPPKVAPPWP